MVRVKANPFQVDQGDLEYHSLLDDNSSNRGGGRSSTSRGGSSSYYGGSNYGGSATTQSSTSWVGNYAAIIAVVLFFTILYSGGFQESDPADNSSSTPTSTYSHSHSANNQYYEVDSKTKRSEDTTSSGIYDNSNEGNNNNNIHPSAKSDQSEEESDDDEYEDESVVDDAYSSSSEDGYDDDDEEEEESEEDGDYEDDDDKEWSDDDDVAWEDIDDTNIDDDELKDDDIIDVDDDDDYGDETEDEYSEDSGSTDDTDESNNSQEEYESEEEDDDVSNMSSTQSDDQEVEGDDDDDDDDDNFSTSKDIPEDSTKKSHDSDNEEKTEPTNSKDTEEGSASTSGDESGNEEEGPATEDTDIAGDHTSDGDSSTLLAGKDEDVDHRPSSSDGSAEETGGTEISGQNDDDKEGNNNKNPPSQSDDANSVPVVVEEDDKDSDDENEEKGTSDEKSTKGIDSQDTADEGALEVSDSTSKDKEMTEADSTEQGESEVDSQDTVGESTSTEEDGTSMGDNMAGNDSTEKFGSEVDGNKDMSVPTKEGDSTIRGSVQETPAKGDANADTQEANEGQDGSAENGGDGGPGATDSEEVTAPVSDESFSKGTGIFQHDPRVLSDKYLPRGKPIDDATKEFLTTTWGSWTFVDPKASSQRPKEDFYADYPNRDVPRDQFPKNAWQTDKEYLSEFLPQATALVERAMEAILSEYGHGERDEPGVSFDERSKMFELVFTENLKENESGGTTNQKSFDGLIRRVLHSIVTESTFTFVMGGHSAAAGHGNHFQQSYTLQFQRVMEPVFARLGVKCTSHNFGYGGLGTSQNGLAAGEIYGSDVDFLVWDSGMTEREKHVIDMFMRQGLIGGKKVPMLWGGHADILERLHKYAGADVGMPGSGLSGVPKTVDMKQALDLPWAVRYLDCEKDIYSECRGVAYNGTCWIDRPDFVPKRQQRAEPTGRAKWHPGNRAHQLKGRVLAFTVLRALKTGLSLWREAENYELSDDLWHVTTYYDTIRTAVMSAIPKQDNNDCYDMNLPDRVCTLPIHGRTENTPRANPAETSIRSIIPKQSRYVPLPLKNIYDPPDVFNPALDVPEGEIDYLSIVENGDTFLQLRARVQEAPTQERKVLEKEDTNGQAEKSTPANTIVPGEGWGLDTLSAPDNCDGSYDSFCGRSEDNECLLYGHNDYRGGLVFDGLSGWMVMNLDDFKHGIIMIKVEDWHQSGENKKTEGWKCENNADGCNTRTRRGLGEVQYLRLGGTSAATTTETDIEKKRQLKPAVPEYCSDFQFQFAIDGEITTWDLTEWLDRMVHLQRVVQLWTLMDDETYGSGGDDEPSKTVELAIRATGCARTKTFYLTHVYWA